MEFLGREIPVDFFKKAVRFFGLKFPVSFMSGTHPFFNYPAPISLYQTPEYSPTLYRLISHVEEGGALRVTPS